MVVLSIISSSCPCSGSRVASVQFGMTAPAALRRSSLPLAVVVMMIDLSDCHSSFKNERSLQSAHGRHREESCDLQIVLKRNSSSMQADLTPKIDKQRANHYVLGGMVCT